MKLGFFGCGNMGEAFLGGIIKKGVCSEENILVYDRAAERLQILQEKYAVATTLNSNDLEDCDVLFLGFKPQGLSTIGFTPKAGMIVISMLVGKEIVSIEEKFPQTKIARIMPNVGLFVGKGMTGLFFNPENTFTSEERETVRSLLTAGEKVLELEAEEQIDKLSTISGSGPAYFFRFAEALQQSAEQLGFTPEQSELMVKQTLIGSAQLLQDNPNDSCALWREKVTSPKGTTEQALRIFNENDINALVQEAVDAAKKRSEELSKEV